MRKNTKNRIAAVSIAGLPVPWVTAFENENTHTYSKSIIGARHLECQAAKPICMTDGFAYEVSVLILVWSSIDC
jgi:hypothetical protein